MDSPVSKNNVRLRLEANYQALTPARRRLCDFVEQNAEAILHMTISELGKAASVSDATITRLCQGAGYSGYSEFRVLLARDLARTEQQPTGELQSNDTGDNIRDKLIAGSITSLEGPRQLLDLEMLHRASESNSNSKAVSISTG